MNSPEATPGAGDDHEPYQILIMGSLDGEISPAEEEKLKSHLAECRECSAELVKYRRLADMATAVKLKEPKDHEWERFQNRGFEVRLCGSVAYKLAQVAAGLADASWSLVPKYEWDVAAGVALVRAAGGYIEVLEEPERRFNSAHTLMAGLVACSGPLEQSIRREIGL